jgi:hypothetical protein
LTRARITILHEQKGLVDKSKNNNPKRTIRAGRQEQEKPAYNKNKKGWLARARRANLQ